LTKAKIAAVKEAVEVEKKRAEDERKRLITYQERKESLRLQMEAKVKANAEEKARLEAEMQAKLESKKKYQKFLSDNKYKENDPNFLLKNEGGVVTLFKKIDSFKI